MSFHSLGGLEMRFSRILAENSQRPKLKTAKDIDMKQEKKKSSSRDVHYLLLHP